MNAMFLRATSFNQDINTKTITKTDGSKFTAWDVSNVNYMAGMFSNATSFYQNIDGWNVSSVTDMSNMFNNCPIYPIPSWYNI